MCQSFWGLLASCLGRSWGSQSRAGLDLQQGINLTRNPILRRTCRLYHLGHHLPHLRQAIFPWLRGILRSTDDAAAQRRDAFCAPRDATDLNVSDDGVALRGVRTSGGSRRRTSRGAEPWHCTSFSGRMPAVSVAM
ncbi:hypothetical protein F4776DRAFT_80701 [Hypoxylon sp. NC0597]|nr:hypothetical protein F4776DRAFT_80701 [Hypoxylon sp. NC0597]